MVPTVGPPEAGPLVFSNGAVDHPLSRAHREAGEHFSSYSIVTRLLRPNQA